MTTNEARAIETKEEPRMYASELTTAANRTGDPLRLKIDARQIADTFGMDAGYVMDDLQRMRRILCADAIRKAVAS